MLSRRFFWLVALSVGILIATYFILRDTSEMAEFARSPTDYRGQILTGEKFGISIGDSTPLVTEKLKGNGLIYRETSSIEHNRKTPDTCHGFKYENIDMIRLYYDPSWRRGVVCVIVKDDAMVAMSWFFQPGSP